MVILESIFSFHFSSIWRIDKPYLGFLHSEQFGKPGLVCDFMELYRYLIDNFLIQHCKGIGKKSFVTKYEVLSRRKIGKREFLNDCDSKGLIQGLNRLFESNMEISRIRVGKRQTFETLINEEGLLLAKYLRKERERWIPRLPSLKPQMDPSTNYLKLINFKKVTPINAFYG